MLALGDKFFLTEQVLQEVRDPRAEAVVEIVRPEIVQVDQRELQELRSKYPDLSEADCSIILCALQLRRQGMCQEVVVVTDDMKLRSILRKLGIKVETVFFGKKRAPLS